MSSSFLGGGDKGATSVLRNVGGRVDIDRSLHQDRYVPAQGVAGPSRQRPASSRSRQPHNAFDLSELSNHLVPQGPAARHENWASGFAPPQQQQHVQKQQAGPVRTASPWQRDYLQSQQHPSARIPQSQAGPTPWQTSTSPPPQLAQQHPLYRPLPYHYAGAPLPPQHTMPMPMPMPLFPQADQQQPLERERNQPEAQQERTRPSEPLTESQEVLARTARELVNDVDASAGLLRDNPKLAKSQFWQLMRGLGDGEVVVQDDPAASTSEPVGDGAKFVSRAESQNWASDFLGAGPSTAHAEPHQARTLPATLDTPDFYERQRMAQQAAWPDQDAITQSRPGGMQQRPKSVHFDDFQEQEAGAVERSGVPNNLEEALRSTTGIAGTSSQWEESGLDLDDFDETAFMNYNGPLRQSASSRIGVGDLENWGGMQRDWENLQRTEPALRQGQTGQNRYLFQSRNPYTAMAGDADMGRESPTFKGVLELEAAVQQDPSDHEAWYALGLKQQENEREDQAIRALTKVLDLDPDYRPAYLALAVSYTNEGEHDRSRVMLSKWIGMAEAESGGQGETEALVGDALGHGRLVDRLIDLARRNPEEVDPEVQIALGVLFNSSEEYVKAEDCFSAALSVRPDDWLLHNRLGATLANSGRSNEAIAYYHRALSLHPNFVRALFNLGISYINLAQYPLAAQHILSAIRLQHSDATEAYSSGTLGTSAKGVTSDALWNSLRTACLHMGRHDLVDLAARKDITAFPDTFETLDLTAQA